MAINFLVYWVDITDKSIPVSPVHISDFTVSIVKGKVVTLDYSKAFTKYFIDHDWLLSLKFTEYIPT